jgi:hypothetical protein
MYQGSYSPEETQREFKANAPTRDAVLKNRRGGGAIPVVLLY